MSTREQKNNEKRNSARAKLAAIGINVDDVPTQTIPKAIAVYDTCVQKKEMHDMSFINYSTIEKATGITRKTLSENTFLDRIVKHFANEATDKHDRKIQEMKDRIDILTEADRHHQETLRENFIYEKEIADRDAEIKMLESEKKALQEALSNTEDENKKLKQIIANYRRQIPVDVRINEQPN